MFGLPRSNRAWAAFATWGMSKVKTLSWNGGWLAEDSIGLPLDPTNRRVWHPRLGVSRPIVTFRTTHWDAAPWPTTKAALLHAVKERGKVQRAGAIPKAAVVVATARAASAVK